MLEVCMFEHLRISLL